MTENSFKVKSAAVSDRGLSEKRPENEDSFLEMQNLGVFAVADGVGGAQAGDVASQMAMEILGEAFINLQENGDVEEMMKLAIERANSAIYQMSCDLPQLATMATTIVALNLTGNIATIGHVGDSRLYRVDPRGSLYRETQDHSVVEEEVRAGRMTEAQAANHPSRNVISRALGAESTVEVDMKTIMFEPNTSFLLCSDGITRHVNDFEIRELLLAKADPSETCQKMKEICYARGAEDNLTAVIISVTETIDGEYVNQHEAGSPADEEATVATPRYNVEPPTFTEAREDYDDIPTGGLEMPVSMQTPEADGFTPPAGDPDYLKDDDEAYLMDEPRQETSETEAETPTTSSLADYSVGTGSEPGEVIERQRMMPTKDLTDFESKANSGGSFAKLLSPLLLVLVGAILGVSGYYLWLLFSLPATVPPVLTPQTNNIPKNSTDTLRYDAEANPEKVIKQYETTAPKDAGDFYILGKAFLKLKNYEEAKRQFIIARNNLRAVKDTETRTILDANITEGMVFSEDKSAQAAHAREEKSSPLFETEKPPNEVSNSRPNSPGGASTKDR